MSQIEELKNEIAQMNKALSNSQMPDAAKGNLQAAIKNAVKQLSDLETDPPAPAPTRAKVDEIALVEKHIATEKNKDKKKILEKKKGELQATQKLKKEVAEPSKAPKKAEVKEVPTKAELRKDADVVPTGVLHEYKRVHVGCEMFATQNETADAEVIHFVGGEMVAYPGDWILYLGDGHPFTVIQKQNFDKRCIVIKNGERSQITIKKADGTVKKVKNTEGGVVEKAKPKKRRMTPRIEKGVQTLATKMKAKDCSIAEFIKDTDGTPIDDSIWGRIAQWNAKTTAEKITKVGIEKDGEHPRFIAETVDYSEMFRTIRYYSVCADKGEWSLINDIEKPKIAQRFEDKGFKMQYSRAEIGRMYNYGDPTQKSYDTHLMECKTIAADAYKTRIEKGSIEARPKYQKHYNTCRNQVLNAYNRAFLIDLNELARKHKDENKALTFREAFKAIRAKLREHTA